MDHSDYIEHGVLSNCCDAQIIHGDICTACKEHCEAVNEENEDDD